MAPRVSWAVATQADRRQTRINDKNTFRFTFTPLTRLRDRPHKIELWFHPSSGRETGRTKLNYGFTRQAAARPAAHRWNISQDFRYTILADVHFTSSIIHRSGNFELIIFNTQLAFFVGALSSPLQGAVSPCPENPKPGSCAFSTSFTDTPPDPTPSSARFRCFIALPPPVAAARAAIRRTLLPNTGLGGWLPASISRQPKPGTAIQSQKAELVAVPALRRVPAW